MRQTDVILPPESSRIKSRRILLAPGEDVGEHVSEGREEMIVILKGTATIMADGKPFEVGEGECHYIKEGVRHNVINRSPEGLEYVYVAALFSSR